MPKSKKLALNSDQPKFDKQWWSLNCSLSSILLAVQIFCARQLKQVALGTGQEFSGSFNFCAPNERLLFVIYFLYRGSSTSTHSDAIIDKSNIYGRRPFHLLQNSVKYYQPTNNLSYFVLFSR